MGCYVLMLKEAEQFVLSCHNFDCENSMSGAWVAAWKNKIRMKILDPLVKKSCKQATDWQWGGCTWTPPTCTWYHWPLSELFPTIINENTLLAQKWLSAKVVPCSQRCACQSQSVSCMYMNIFLLPLSSLWAYSFYMEYPLYNIVLWFHIHTCCI